MTTTATESGARAAASSRAGRTPAATDAGRSMPLRSWFLPVAILLVLTLACGTPTGTSLDESAAQALAASPGPTAHTRAVGVYDAQVAAACEAGCADRQGYDPAAVVLQPSATVGDLTRCPVSGVVFEVQLDSVVVEVEGDRWYTCCASCAGKLSATPAKFVL